MIITAPLLKNDMVSNWSEYEVDNQKEIKRFLSIIDITFLYTITQH